MTPRHSYYNIAELLDRWTDNKFTEMDLLKWGAEGELQFSILLSDTREPMDMTEDLCEITIQMEHVEDQKYVLCDKRKIGTKRELYKLAPEMVDNIIVSPDKKNRAIKILPWCDGCEKYNIPDKDACQVLKSPGTTAETHAEAQGDFRQLWKYGKDDLVVEHNEVKRFEKEFPVFEENTPPYMDPEKLGYSSELAIAINTWKALFIDGININEVSGKEAGHKYLLTEYKNREFSKNMRMNIVAVAASKYVHSHEWKKFQDKKSSSKD